MLRFKDLLDAVYEVNPKADMELLEEVYRFAEDLHKGQYRKSGEPYIIHPLSVAIILANLGMDEHTIAAGLLHDVLEDTDCKQKGLVDHFGQEVTFLVNGVTKLSKLECTSKEERQLESYRKMFIAMAEDVRVVMVKLADRLHNMRTLKYQKPESQQRIAKETLEIYSPIAQRLGISKIKVELDDLSLKYLEPDVYYDLVTKISARKSERERYIQSIVDEVTEHINSAGIKAQIDGRVKHFFSIYKKMKNQNKTLEQIYDLFAVRIIVDSVKDCYAALGVIHEMYKPIPGRFKDYIAMPKPNMYQSLHTTLIGSTGQPFEIQIRTTEMHKAAEYGIAAHWKYKDASDGKKVEAQEEEKLVWLRQILEWQRDMSDNREFMNLLKSDLDLFSDSVYCFTPTGEVKNLPAGSTPIDFAYSIHSAVGNKMVGARVNDKLVTIDYVIKNGDRIEVITSANSKGPSRDWLNLVKSTQAKNKINQWFKAEYKEENIVKGKEMLTTYCKNKAITLANLLKPDYMEAIQRKYGFKDWDAVLAAIGHGALKEGQIVNKMQEFYDRDNKKEVTNDDILRTISESNANRPVKMHSKSGIVVKGMTDLSVRFSKCCSPVPGDEIVGFVTRGRGISVHRTDCVNVMNLPDIDRERLIDADWQIPEEAGSFEKYMAEIMIYANNRHGLLADISKALTEKNINIMSMNCRINKQDIATLQMNFEISGRDELIRVIDKIRGIESVIDIERTVG